MSSLAATRDCRRSVTANRSTVVLCTAANCALGRTADNGPGCLICHSFSIGETPIDSATASLTIHLPGGDITNTRVMPDDAGMRNRSPASRASDLLIVAATIFPPSRTPPMPLHQLQVWCDQTSLTRLVSNELLRFGARGDSLACECNRRPRPHRRDFNRTFSDRRFVSLARSPPPPVRPGLPPAYRGCQFLSGRRSWSENVASET
jgi:hypothetical protein